MPKSSLKKAETSATPQSASISTIVASPASVAMVSTDKAERKAGRALRREELAIAKAARHAIRDAKKIAASKEQEDVVMEIEEIIEPVQVEVIESNSSVQKVKKAKKVEKKEKVEKVVEMELDEPIIDVTPLKSPGELAKLDEAKKAKLAAKKVTKRAKAKVGNSISEPAAIVVEEEAPATEPVEEGKTKRPLPQELEGTTTENTGTPRRGVRLDKRKRKDRRLKNLEGVSPVESEIEPEIESPVAPSPEIIAPIAPVASTSKILAVESIPRVKKSKSKSKIPIVVATSPPASTTEKFVPSPTIPLAVSSLNMAPNHQITQSWVNPLFAFGQLFSAFSNPPLQTLRAALVAPAPRSIKPLRKSKNTSEILPAPDSALEVITAESSTESIEKVARTPKSNKRARAKRQRINIEGDAAVDLPKETNSVEDDTLISKKSKKSKRKEKLAKAMEEVVEEVEKVSVDEESSKKHEKANGKKALRLASKLAKKEAKQVLEIEVARKEEIKLGKRKLVEAEEEETVEEEGGEEEEAEEEEEEEEEEVAVIAEVNIITPNIVMEALVEEPTLVDEEILETIESSPVPSDFEEVEDPIEDVEMELDLNANLKSEIGSQVDELASQPSPPPALVDSSDEEEEIDQLASSQQSSPRAPSPSRSIIRTYGSVRKSKLSQVTLPLEDSSDEENSPIASPTHLALPIPVLASTLLNPSSSPGQNGSTFQSAQPISSQAKLRRLSTIGNAPNSNSEGSSSDSDSSSESESDSSQATKKLASRKSISKIANDAFGSQDKARKARKSMAIAKSVSALLTPAVKQVNGHVEEKVDDDDDEFNLLASQANLSTLDILNVGEAEEKGRRERSESRFSEIPDEVEPVERSVKVTTREMTAEESDDEIVSRRKAITPTIIETSKSDEAMEEDGAQEPETESENEMELDEAGKEDKVIEDEMVAETIEMVGAAPSDEDSPAPEVTVDEDDDDEPQLEIEPSRSSPLPVQTPLFDPETQLARTIRSQSLPLEATQKESQPEPSQIALVEESILEPQVILSPPTPILDEENFASNGNGKHEDGEPIDNSTDALPQQPEPVEAAASQNNSTPSQSGRITRKSTRNASVAPTIELIEDSQFETPFLSQPPRTQTRRATSAALPNHVSESLLSQGIPSSARKRASAMMGLDALAAATPRRGRSSSQQVISSVKKTIVTPFASQGTASKPWIGGDEDSEDDEEIEGKKQKSKLWS